MSANQPQRGTRPLRLFTTGTVLGLIWVLIAGVTGIHGAPQQGTIPWKPKPGTEDQYAGSETCVMCHVEHGEAFPENPHAGAGSEVEHPNGDLTCEACHGPGMAHADSGGDPEEMKNFTEKASAEISKSCLGCHAGSARNARYMSSDHAAGDLSCVNCHSVHSPEVMEGLKVTSSPGLCFTCHVEVRASFAGADRHGLGNGLVNCENCHNPHGSMENSMLARPMINGELCAVCHIDKRGPFVFDHAAGTVEGCVACHTPHGSPNRFMLKTNMTSELCVTCHVDAPTFHNMADLRYRNCTTCHTAIHGSDSHHLFFSR